MLCSFNSESLNIGFRTFSDYCVQNVVNEKSEQIDGCRKSRVGHGKVMGKTCQTL